MNNLAATPQKKLRKTDKRTLAKKDYTKYDWVEIRTKLEEYSEVTTVPILNEFFYKFKVPGKQFETQIENGDEKLGIVRDFLIYKKQAQLERGTLSGQFNPAMAIFSLKQMGWRDNPPELAPGVNFNFFFNDEQKKRIARSILDVGNTIGTRTADDILPAD